MGLAATLSFHHPGIGARDDFSTPAGKPRPRSKTPGDPGKLPGDSEFTAPAAKLPGTPEFSTPAGKLYPTGQGTPDLTPSSNSPQERPTGANRTWRSEASEIDWPALVKRCLEGDTAAWAELVAGQQRRVYGLCYRFTGSSHDAEDLAQDVFIKVYANLRTFDSGKGSLSTWITSLTRNLLVDHFRRSRQQRVTDSMDAGWDQAGDVAPGEPIVDHRTTPFQHAVQVQLEGMVQTALAKVSPELREAVILRDLQDMDYKEIAEVLAIPQGTVKSRISRGRAELARLLERTKGQVV
jgi:RNA polymerase sigma-70 factor, ECF subfamily